MKTQKQQQFEDLDYHVRNKPIKQEMNKPMTPQNKLYEAVNAVIEIHEKESEDVFYLHHMDKAITELKKAKAAYEQEQPKPTGITSPALAHQSCKGTLQGENSEVVNEQPETIAGEKTIEETLSQFIGWSVSEITFHPGICIMYGNEALAAMHEYASQQTAHKDQKITDLSGELHATDKLNQELQDEIAELKEAISELIQVKDWKDQYGKDEHYLKAMPIAWENVRKLIQK